MVLLGRDRGGGTLIWTEVVKKAKMRDKRQAEYKARRPRQCKGCRACCYVFSIGRKPGRQWCKQVTPTGCGCHNESRPDICKNYRCCYLLGKGWPLSFRPDHSGLIVTGRGRYDGHGVVGCSEVWPDAAATTGLEIVNFLRKHNLLIVVSTATGDYLIGDHLGIGSDDVLRFREWIVETTAKDREAHKQIDFEFASCA